MPVIPFELLNLRKRMIQTYGEQKRVLKEDGSYVVLSARKGIYIEAFCVTEETDLYDSGLYF